MVEMFVVYFLGWGELLSSTFGRVVLLELLKYNLRGFNSLNVFQRFIFR